MKSHWNSTDAGCKKAYYFSFVYSRSTWITLVWQNTTWHLSIQVWHEIEWCYLSRKLLSREDHEKVLANQRLSCLKIMGGDGCNVGNVFSSCTVVKFSLYISRLTINSPWGLMCQLRSIYIINHISFHIINHISFQYQRF